MTYFQFVPHRKNVKSPLQSPTGQCCVGKQSLFTVRTVRNIQRHIHSVRTSQETHYVTVTKPKRIMLFGEQSLYTVRAVRTHDKYALSPYLTRNSLHRRYRHQPINAVRGNSRCLLWEPYGTHRYIYTQSVPYREHVTSRLEKPTG
jgi:hypothetical protein